MAGNKRTNRTARKKKLFLECFEQEHSVWHACKKAGIGRRTVYEWRDNDEEFRQSWEDIDDFIDDELEASMRKRAAYGTREYLYYQGQPVLVHQRNEKGEIDEDLPKVHAYQVRYESSVSLRMLAARRGETYHLEKKQFSDLPAGSTGVLLVPAAQSLDDWVDNARKVDAERDAKRDDEPSGEGESGGGTSRA